ncbi:DUF924 family protein [Catenovulum maritimum]|uniref:Membrane protein n=1 Tax=Catenovulum maritimum TaxID=1513271 RepID=A0A0J8GNR1_9ALTE|nr:DUF924 family protein [Catenovulum maritimum]KMT64465.1 membrane protein [Catenovulum maritimum]
MRADDVINFWFTQLEPKQWWVKDEALDSLIKSQFLATLNQAKRGELYHWRTSIQGRLAEIIVLDQFSRNIYRGQPDSFSADSIALVLSQEAISLGLDQSLNPEQKSFLYMPFMHSESATIHQVAVKLFKDNNLASNYEFELKHKEIIDKFGRYPHRNNILGRESTAEELAFLQQPGSSF